ncbi:ArsR/SmtB family transcription factor [Streptomonospora nanhaiensis]|uniref:DNA-binding transcriptional ArsR family regulator n=1 Tax=Streptomonospora nanhaiensis TaxID=1323731 RepID=A0A853BRV8_9ACTN|nr:metalloregulator ArsR/SmtB family transcription factor [Streptomonospora nanhaiensis]MBV2362270.1 metalloregulator ArsR/SmtB family transcription factor [Streptomonospora nanhaiensis]NYI97287.1 DNA-binding transcriptional ArsR family regulator [Streptomonospora nanhaiensis]
MGVADAVDLDLALRGLADGNRRAILRAIRSEPQPVGSIAEKVGLSQQTTSHHLGVLRKAGLVVGTREGTRHLFVVNTDGIAAVRSYLDEFWPARLAALKAVIEAGQGEARG